MKDPNRFPETHWSLVLRAAASEDPRHREHLDRLLRRYWRPTYAYLSAMRPLDARDLEDLTQGFFAMLLARRSLASLDPARGSFRGFLKTALRRFVLTHDRSTARHPEHSLSPDGTADETTADPQRPLAEEAFDRAWMREVLGAAVARVRADLVARGKGVYMDVFDAYDLADGDTPSYDAVGARFGLGADDVRNHLRAVRKWLRAAVREEVRAYLLPTESEEDELRFLLR